MDDQIIVVLTLGLFCVLLLLRVPISYCLGAAGGIGIVLLSGLSVTSSTLGREPFSAVADYGLVLVPMFVLMGFFVLHAGLAADFYGSVYRILGALPGGLGVATVGASAGFAAVTGSSVATAATVGQIAIHEMRRHGYPAAFSAALVAAGGTLGILIPPSIVLVIYGVLTGESIASLLLAGIIPGIVSAIAFSLCVVAWGARNADQIRSEIDQVSRNVPQTVGALTTPLLQIGALFLIVVAGLYGGFFTATESGALAAFAAFMVLAWRQRRSWRAIRDGFLKALHESAQLTSMVMMILVGGGIFSYFLLSAGVPTDFTRWATSLDLPPHVIVALLLLALIPLGMFLDSFSILLITVPLTYPVITALDMDGIWYAILVVKLIEIGLITPPVGLNVFVVAGIARSTTIERIFKSVVPFIVIDLLVTALLFLVPDIVTWLPEVIASGGR